MLLTCDPISCACSACSCLALPSGHLAALLLSNTVLLDILRPVSWRSCSILPIGQAGLLSMRALTMLHRRMPAMHLLALHMTCCRLAGCLQALCQPRAEKQEVPLRQFTGLDPRRMQQLLAVMDRDTPLRSYSSNIFVNIVGGFQVGGGQGGRGKAPACPA
jgi:hypothetical protein